MVCWSFTSGVMVAASCFGLLHPGHGHAMTGRRHSRGSWHHGLLGFIVEALFALDNDSTRLRINFDEQEAEGPKTDWHRTTLLVAGHHAATSPKVWPSGCCSVGRRLMSSTDHRWSDCARVGHWHPELPRGHCREHAAGRPGRHHRGQSFWFGELGAIVEPAMAQVPVGAVAVLTIDIVALCAWPLRRRR